MEGLGSVGARIGQAVRARRRAAGTTLEELASRSGLSRTILSRIENGHGNPSVETLYRIAGALELPISALLDEAPSPPARRIPARSGTPLRAESGMSAWLIHAEATALRLDVIELELPAGVEHPSEGHLAGTIELIHCLRGRLRAGPVGSEVEVGAGDSAWFRADVPHRLVALRSSRALDLIGTPP